MAPRERTARRALLGFGAVGLGAALLQGACNHDWDAYDPRIDGGAPVGGGPSVGGAGGAGSGLGGAGGGAGGACGPSEGGPCYGGPEGTEGVGVCRGGTLFCGPGGEPLCLGEVRPSPEDCASAVDDDCDTVTNDRCAMWSRRFGGDLAQYPWGIAADGDGAVLVTGELSGTANFGGGALASEDARDVYALKLDAEGNHVWSRRWGGTGDQVGLSIAVDPAGNVYLTGYFENTLDLGALGVLASAGDRDVFVMKLDAGGTPLWAQRYGDVLAQSGRAIAADASGVVVAGGFAGTLDLGGAAHVSADLEDGFVLRLDTDGNHVWSRGFGGEKEDVALGVALDATGAVLLTGSFDEQIDLGGGATTDAGALDAFAAKLDAAGNHAWTVGLGAANDQVGRAVAADADGNVLVAGTFLGGINLGGGPRQAIGGRDAFVVKLSAGGAYLWGHTWGNPAEQVAHTVAVDPGGGVIVGLGSSGLVDYGGGPLLSAGADDMVVVQLDAAGAHVMSRRFGDNDDQDVRAAAATPQGAIVIAGECEGTVDFGVGAMSSGGEEDICIAKLAP